MRPDRGMCGFVIVFVCRAYRIAKCWWLRHDSPFKPGYGRGSTALVTLSGRKSRECQGFARRSLARLMVGNQVEK